MWWGMRSMSSSMGRKSSENAINCKTEGLKIKNPKVVKIIDPYLTDTITKQIFCQP
jgi:hypothetical protein